MNRKIIISILSIILAISSFFVVGCFGGNNEPNREISSKLLQVMDGTFSSAEYVIGGDKGSKSAELENISICSLSFNEPEYSSELEDLTRLFYGTGGGVPLTDNNIKALKGEALSNGSSFASMARALADVYGDEIFNECYSYQNISFKITGDNDNFTINGALFEDNKYRSGFQMRLAKEKDETYSYNYVEYTINTTFALLKISAFSKDGVLNVELNSNDLNIFSSYEESYSEFSLQKITVANFNIDNYASVTFNHTTPSTLEQVESVLKFSKNVLGNGVDTYNYVKSIKSTKKMSKDDISKISAIVNETYYVCPYYYENNKSYVREEYVVPSSVTVIKTGSIPATKTIHIHGNVTKIESRPFQQPEYLENIIFTNPDSTKLTEIGSFDYSTGEPSFILSMTKVKNFTLPASVKKLELGLYILNTEVECLDLSSYEPTWLTDNSKFTYKFDTSDSKHNDYIKADYRNSAYVKLRLGGIKDYNYKELRYINTIKMPKFNMGIDLKDTSHYSVKDSSGVEYYSEAHRVVTDALKFSDMTEDEFFEINNYTETYDCIGEIYFNTKNTIVSKDLLYSDVSDKEDMREDFDIELYSTGHKIDSFSTVKYVYVNASDYYTASTIEEKQAKRFGVDRLLNDRPQIVINGTSGLSFNGFDIDKLYNSKGQKIEVSNLKVGDKFYAPNLEGNDSVKKVNGVNTYFAGWSYVENGSVNIYPFEIISNNMQTLYPVYLPADTAFDYKMKDDGTYKASYNNSGSGKILIVPSEYNGKKVTEFDKIDGYGSREIEVVIFAHGIETIGYPSVSSDIYILPTTIKSINRIGFDEDKVPTYKNSYYMPIGSNPFGLLAKADYDSESCNIHDDTLIIGCEAFSGTSVENVTIPSKVKIISVLAFAYIGIKEIVIPSSVETIGNCAFISCEELTRVEFKDGLKSIGTQAFSGCYKLKTVILPNTLETLASDVFEYCENIEGKEYGNGIYLGTSTNDYFALINVVDVTADTLTVHDNTKFISFDLDECSGADKIYIGKNVKEITLNLFSEFENSFVNVYYKGSQKDWNSIIFTGYEFKTTWQQLVSDNYSELGDFTIHYNS